MSDCPGLSAEDEVERGLLYLHTSHVLSLSRHWGDAVALDLRSIGRGFNSNREKLGQVTHTYLPLSSSKRRSAPQLNSQFQFLLFSMCWSITLVYKLCFYVNICSFFYKIPFIRNIHCNFSHCINIKGKTPNFRELPSPGPRLFFWVVFYDGL